MTETTTVEPTETPDASSIISAIAKGDTVGAGNSFEDIMQQKKLAALDARRQDFAASMFNAPSEQEPAVEEE